MMKVLGVVGSGRLNGNSQVLVEEALQAARGLGAETELFLAGQKSIAPCDGCECCRTSGECRIDDDMQELYIRLMEADGIIFGSPVYCWNVSAQAKAIIDRTYRFKSERELAGRAGGALVVSRGRGESTALWVLLSWFATHGMVVAGGASALGDGPGDVRKDTVGMEEARRVGRAVATVARGGPLTMPAQ